MTLDQYLEQFIEGYLFEDLHAMAPIQLAPEQRYGAVGYPMVMTALSGIEVLGALTSRTIFKQDNGGNRFGEFWREYVYVDQPAFQRLDEIVYQLVRHGLAHSFMTKPMIRVTKHHDGEHLCRAKDKPEIFVIDALTLAEDLETAYRDRLRPNMTGELKKRMETRFNEFRKSYQDEYAIQKTRITRAPLGRPLTSPKRTVLPMQVNSPSVGVSYSTNAGTTSAFGRSGDDK